MNYHATGSYLAVLLIFVTVCECGSKVIRVANSTDFKSALDRVIPGDVISLRGNTTYKGTFIATRSGSRTLPITLLTENFENSSYARIVGDEDNHNAAALTIAVDYYKLENIKIVHKTSLGLLVDGSDVSLEGVVVQKTETAIRINGARSYLKDCSISEVKKGIQLDSDFNVVRDTFVTGDGIVSLQASKETCCGTIMGNVFDGRLDIKGTDYNLFDNVIGGNSQ